MHTYFMYKKIKSAYTYLCEIECFLYLQYKHARTSMGWGVVASSFVDYIECGTVHNCSMNIGLSLRGICLRYCVQATQES